MIVSPEQRPSQLVMDDAARRLGAPDAATFLSIAPPSMQSAFKLICQLLMEHEYGPEGIWKGEQFNRLGSSDPADIQGYEGN